MATTYKRPQLVYITGSDNEYFYDEQIFSSAIKYFYIKVDGELWYYGNETCCCNHFEGATGFSKFSDALNKAKELKEKRSNCKKSEVFGTSERTDKIIL